MTSEGGGKLKQKRAHTAKPYERPKSIFSRVTDAVRGILSPSWVTGLITSQAVASDAVSNCNNNSDDYSSATLRRNSLNSLPGPSGVTFPPVVAHANDKRQSVKPRIPLDNAHEPFWNPAIINLGRSTPPFAERSDPHTPLLTPSAFVTGYLAESAAGPSTSTPCDGAKECVSRRNGEREKANAGSSSSTPLPPASRQLYAKLSGIGKLNQYSSVAERKEELESGTNQAVGDSQSECSEESISTSGCSSMVPHPDKREYQRDVLQLSKPGLETLSENLQKSISTLNKNESGWDQTIGGNERTRSTKPSFLFSELNTSVSRSAKPQPIAMGSKPQFKPYLLGSPTWTEKSLLLTNPSNLSFNGKATYGFGSARKARLNSIAPYTTAPPLSRRHVQVKAASNADLDVMSNTTKRILETLEKMSTPLMDAKKIPTNKTDAILDTPLTFTSTCRRRPILSNKGGSQISKVENSSVASISRGPPISRLMTPCSVSVTKMFPMPGTPSSLQVSQAKNTDASKESKANEQSAVTQLNEVKKASGKMKTSRQREHYSRNSADCDERYERPDLPSVTLPLKKLPVFDFFPQTSGNQLSNSIKSPKFASPSGSVEKPFTAPLTPSVSNNVASKALLSMARSTPPITVTTTVPVTNCTGAKQNSEPISFKFSTPAQVKEAVDGCSDNAKLTLSESEVQFEFRPPESVENKPDSLPKESPAANASITTSNFVFKSPSAPIVSLKQKIGCSPEQSPKHSNVPVSSELRSGSVLDLLAKFAETNQKNASDSKTKSDKDMDILTEKNGNTSAVDGLDTKTTTTASIGFGDSFKSATGNWECPSCLINNKAEATKCVACETAKSTVKSASTAVAAPFSAASNSSLFSGFGDRFSNTSDTWECPSCMLRIKQELQKCLACETPKPGAKPDDPSAPVNMFGNKFSSLPATKIGSSPAQPGLKDARAADSGMWECDTCLVKNQPTAMKCIACESSKPGVAPLPSTTSGFKFGFATLTSSSTTASPHQFSSQFSGATASVVNSTPSITSTVAPLIKFGIPSTLQSGCAPASSNVTSGFSFASKNTEKDGAAASQAPFKFGVPADITKEDSKAPTTTASAGFKFPKSLPLVEAQTQNQSATAVEDKPEAQLGKTITEDVPVVVAASSQPPAYNVSFQLNTGKTSNESSGPLQVATEKSENPLLFKSAAPTMPTVPAGSRQPFSFSSGKPASESTFSFTPTTTAIPTLPAMPAVAVPSSGFNFKFGGDTSASALTGAAKPAAFSFLESKTTSKETSTASTSGGFPFTFGAGGKRTADAIDDCSVAKKSSVSSGLSTFGSFGPTGNTAVNVAPSSGFAFGSAPALSRTPVFGALSSGGDKPAASNTFTFGASPTSPNPASVLSAFNAPNSLNAERMFGSKQSTPFQPASQPTLNFGTPNPLTTSASTFGAPTNTSTFSFTGQNTANNNVGSSIPAFGSPAAPSAGLSAFGATPSGSVFGSAPAPNFGAFCATHPSSVVNPTPAPAAPSTGFNFGLAPNFQFGNQAQTGTGVFQFSGNQGANTETQASNQGFAFGQMASTNQQQPTQQPGFSFPLSYPPVPTLSSTNPFEIQNKAGGRTIKKAKRRTHQK